MGVDARPEKPKLEDACPRGHEEKRGGRMLEGVGADRV